MQLNNQVTLVGNMQSEVQVTNFNNGGKIVRFKLETSSYPQNNKSVRHRVFAWGNMAQFIERYGKKGKQLAIQGRLVNRTYTTKKGNARKYTEVEVRHVIAM